MCNCSGVREKLRSTAAFSLSQFVTLPRMRLGKRRKSRRQCISTAPSVKRKKKIIGERCRGDARRDSNKDFITSLIYGAIKRDWGIKAVAALSQNFSKIAFNIYADSLLCLLRDNVAVCMDDSSEIERCNIVGVEARREGSDLWIGLKIKLSPADNWQHKCRRFVNLFAIRRVEVLLLQL